MLDAKDLEAISAIMDQKLDALEERMDKKMDQKLAKQEKRILAIVDKRIAKSENLVLRELDRIHIQMNTRMDKVEDLSGRVADLEKVVYA